jgi:alkylhydroperoxidase family enzyme
MVDFALKLTQKPDEMRREDIERLKKHGFTEKQVVDIVVITCTFNFMDRLADGLGVELDPFMQKLVDINADKG